VLALLETSPSWTNATKGRDEEDRKNRRDNQRLVGRGDEERDEERRENSHRIISFFGQYEDRGEFRETTEKDGCTARKGCHTHTHTHTKKKEKKRGCQLQKVAAEDKAGRRSLHKTNHGTRQDKH
jgi:hypothetical protein